MGAFFLRLAHAGYQPFLYTYSLIPCGFDAFFAYFLCKLALQTPKIRSKMAFSAK
jgi:hypothetical protein